MPDLTKGVAWYGTPVPLYRDDLPDTVEPSVWALGIYAWPQHPVLPLNQWARSCTSCSRSDSEHEAAFTIFGFA